MAESEAPDRIEIWAKRVGRGLGFIALAVLALYLVAVYVRP
jgi:hypothetical protein